MVSFSSWTHMIIKDMISLREPRNCLRHVNLSAREFLMFRKQKVRIDIKNFKNLKLEESSFL